MSYEMKLKIFTIFALMTTLGICARSCDSLDKHCILVTFFLHALFAIFYLGLYLDVDKEAKYELLLREGVS
jgi:hypothetical protein